MAQFDYGDFLLESEIGVNFIDSKLRNGAATLDKRGGPGSQGALLLGSHQQVEPHCQAA